jgi:hypothetical protein
MPPMNVDIVRKAYEAVNRGDLDNFMSGAMQETAVSARAGVHEPRGRP